MVPSPRAPPPRPASRSERVSFNWSSGLGYRYGLKVHLGISKGMILMCSQLRTSNPIQPATPLTNAKTKMGPSSGFLQSLQRCEGDSQTRGLGSGPLQLLPPFLAVFPIRHQPEIFSSLLESRGGGSGLSA